MLGQLAVPKKLCLLRLSAIGDVCHAVAMVQKIQQQWPEIQITWVIGKVEASLLSGLANVEFVLFDKRAGLKGYSDLRQQLKGRKFDVLLHMQVALRASLASLCIPAQVKIGFDFKRAKEGQWVFTNKRIEPQSQPHVLEGFMGFAKTLGITNTQPVWNMPINASHEAWVQESLHSAGWKNKPIAVISPAASKAERNWHSEGYAEIADELSKKGFTVVICGGPTTMEKLLAEDILYQSDSSLINMVGKTSLKQLLALLKLAHLVIAPDTGPAHMATTVGTPVLGLYAHSNPKRTGPYLSQQYVVSCYDNAIEEQYHKPVARLAWGVRAKGAYLMKSITTSQVKNMLEKLIEQEYPQLVSHTPENKV